MTEVDQSTELGLLAEAKEMIERADIQVGYLKVRKLEVVSDGIGSRLRLRFLGYGQRLILSNRMAELSPEERKGLLADRISTLQTEQAIIRVQRRWTLRTVIPALVVGIGVLVLSALPVTIGVVAGLLMAGQAANIQLRKKEVRGIRKERAHFAIALAGSLDNWTKGVSRDISDLMEGGSENFLKGDLKRVAAGKAFQTVADASDRVEAKQWVREIGCRIAEFKECGVELEIAPHLVTERDGGSVCFEDSENRIMRRFISKENGMLPDTIYTIVEKETGRVKETARIQPIQVGPAVKREDREL